MLLLRSSLLRFQSRSSVGLCALLTALVLSAGCERADTKPAKDGDDKKSSSDDEDSSEDGDDSSSGDDEEGSEDEGKGGKGSDESDEEKGSTGEKGEGSGEDGESESSKEEPTSDESSSEEDGGDSSSSGEDTKSSEDSSSSGDSGTGSGGGGDKDFKPEDCEKFAWGSRLAEGRTVPRLRVKGYVDKNGDNQVEGTPTTFDMCDLYLTGRKCAVIIHGTTG